MREIKFRGLSDKGVWHFGNYHKLVGSGEMPDITWKDGNRIIDYKPVEFNHHWIMEELKPSDSGWNTWDSYTARHVKHESVGQYTGLKDKNGVEIYEGDIVRGIVKDVHDIFDEKDFTLLDEVGLVKMKEGMWMLSNDKDEYAEGMIYRYDSIEVIGNIHQNPDLIATLNK